MSADALHFTLRPRRAASAFSLVEVLVSMAVVALLLVLLLQTLESTTRVTRISNQRMDAVQQARIIMDSFHTDFANIVTKNGLTAFVSADANGNSRLAFIARGRGPNVSGSDESRFLAVSYELDGHTLKRKVSPVAWNSLDLVGAAIQNAVSSTDVAELAAGVLRFEIVAVLDDGTITALSQAGAWKTNSLNGVAIAGLYSALVLDSPKNVRHVQSLHIAVATVGVPLLSQTGTSTLSTLLGPATDGTTPYEVWSNIISSGGISSVPVPARSSLFIDQRCYNFK
ncbi:MAG TPA: prepilin-type N-terminal cleavage/methylation domain-containing protein [Candidatus Methylacidiphilales bacterium]|nr:prepilin-type N-terminal cleavage/methylation domain-containing protein [Candidatus Methylacidiphilales bacterium]